MNGPDHLGTGRARWRPSCCCGLTLVELVIVLAIIATLTGIAIPLYADVTERARIIRAIADIKTLEVEIAGFEASNKALPADLAEIGRDSLQDPWGNPYQYLNFAQTKGKGQKRKDRFLVPLNSTYDLYSMGKDGQSQPPLTAKASQDDIVRANDGGFVGLARSY
jgi:general secretion pathway protein G